MILTIMGGQTIQCIDEMHCSDDSALYREWAQASRALGYGEKPGMHTEEDVRLIYLAMLKGLEGHEKTNLHDQRVAAARFFQGLQVLEFEVASQSLLTRFPQEVLRGMTKKEYHELFLRYSSQHPETIWAREERGRTINRMAELGMIRKEWYTSV